MPSSHSIHAAASTSHLGESVEDLDDAVGVDGDGHRGVQGVGRELVLVHELGSGDRLRDCHQEVVRLMTASTCKKQKQADVIAISTQKSYACLMTANTVKQPDVMHVIDNPTHPCQHMGGSTHDWVNTWVGTKQGGDR